MVRSAARHHITATLIAVVTSVTTLSVTYHLLTPQCLAPELAPRMSLSHSSTACVIPLQ
ncbi:MAG: hypothetical protein ACFB5Z_16005 [Elainellaceae cyanobacterium]